MEREPPLRGIGGTRLPADLYFGVFLRKRKAAPMSADDLRRKIRNFPVAGLGQRIAAAS